jgi:hypothetical protein
LQQFASGLNLRFFQTSALTGDGVAAVFEHIALKSLNRSSNQDLSPASSTTTTTTTTTTTASTTELQKNGCCIVL